MSTEEPVWRVSITIAIVVILALVAGQLLGQPVLLSYVETESMSPTMEPGDGFVPIPVQIAGPIEEDDVVVFEAEELHGGGLTTHRVVDETERGYITRGDGNPFTDQDGDEPPVREPQIVAKALQVNGQVVVIPGFGTGVERVQSVLDTTQRQLAAALGVRSLVDTQTLALSFFIGTLLWYVVGERRDNLPERAGRGTSRETGLDTRVLVGGCALLLIVTATVAMVAPAGTHEYGIVSASFESDQPTVIPQGESADVAYPVDNGGFIPTVSYIEPASEGVAVRPHTLTVQPRATETATVQLDAPSETGYYRRYVTEHRYLAVLPEPVIQSLYVIHPWLPIAAIDALIGGSFYLFGRILVGTDRLRIRTRSREVPVSTHLRRLVNSLYR
ncbi:S26 family signal peptidase [Halohasta litorea]|uniref:S26 family signal peptidase n=1 Tax=Halohasta litorea TaxID=869891 RepID=A0ABD6D5P2_9EURY|nr:S26 family signal peptidase [Halohasta litorea]